MNPAEPSSTASAQGEQQQPPPLPHQSGEQPKAPTAAATGAAAAAAPAAAQKTPRSLACVLCQHRKIKCDKTLPCANCSKAGLPCTPSTPAVRKKRRPAQDLQQRLARCESLLKQYTATGAPPPPPQDGKAPSATATNTPSDGGTTAATSSSPASQGGGSGASAAAKPAGKLIVEDGTVKFMDDYVWGLVHENLSAMREILDSEGFDEEISPDNSNANTPDETVDLLLSDFNSLDLQDVAPSAVQTFRLWQIFLERVNPVTKIVHVPTMQPIVIEAAAANHHNVAPSMQALLFSIYLVSVVSLSEAEAQHMLDVSRTAALKQFAAGVKAALTKADFLRSYDLVILRALVFYLSSFEQRYDQHATWIWGGLLVRIAHKMGLHRDGERLGLSPFDTEMRRRLWWQMMMRDAKYAVSSGYSDTLLPPDWDTKMPSNINDADLHPGAKELQPSRGPTEMALILMIYTVTFTRDKGYIDLEQRMLAAHFAEPGSPEHAELPALQAEYTTGLDAFEEKLRDLEGRWCDVSAGPSHVMALDLRPAAIARIRCALIPMHELPEFGTELRTAHDNLYRTSLTVHEINVRSYEALAALPTFWFAKTYFQIDGFRFLVTESIRRSQLGLYADRLWRVVEHMYFHHEEFWDMSLPDYARLAALVLRAWRGRERALAEAGIPYDVPEFVTRLRGPAPAQGSSGAESSSSRGPGPPQPMNLDMSPGPALGLQDQQQFELDMSSLDADLFTSLEGVPPMGAFAPFGNYSAPQHQQQQGQHYPFGQQWP